MKTNLKTGIRLLPDAIDNQYQGLKIAQYVFLILTIATLVRSLIHIFAPDGGAQSIATIPLASYPVDAAAAVILMFSLWGLSQLLMGIVYLVVYFKYQSLIPAMYVLMIAEYVMRIVIGQMKPIFTSGTAPGSIGNWIMVPVCVGLLAMSLIRSKRASRNSATLKE